MYTITPDSRSLVPGDENCITITWPVGTPGPDTVVIVSDNGSQEIVIRPGPNDTAVNSRRVCFPVPPGTAAVTIRVSGPGGTKTITLV